MTEIGGALCATPFLMPVQRRFYLHSYGLAPHHVARSIKVFIANQQNKTNKSNGDFARRRPDLVRSLNICIFIQPVEERFCGLSDFGNGSGVKIISGLVS
jgi:hypothetical protein